MSHFSKSEFDFRVSFSPLDREPYMVITTNKTNEIRCDLTSLWSLDTSEQFKKLHLICLPVTQGLHCDGSVGFAASQLQRSNRGAAFPQVCQQLFTPLHWLLLCLVGENCVQKCLSHSSQQQISIVCQIGELGLDPSLMALLCFWLSCIYYWVLCFFPHHLTISCTFES